MVSIEVLVKDGLQSVEVLSDGIMVEFSNGTRCFYPTAFLLSQVGSGANHVFLNYDPSPVTAELNAGALLSALDVSNMLLQ